VHAGHRKNQPPEAFSSQLPSGRHGLPREYVRRSQRTRLLAASIEVAGAEGYAGMTVSAVIAQAGVSRKTFYEFFADREACFLAAFDTVLEQGLAGVREAYDGGTSWPEQLRAALARGLDALAAHPHEARVGFVEVLAAGPRALTRRDDAMRAFMVFLQPGYDAAPATLEVPPLMSEAVVGALYEIVYARVLNGRVGELPGLLPQLVFCALAPFLGAERAAVEAAAARAAAATA
jgi:AcrR family transcriptional regulator